MTTDELPLPSPDGTEPPEVWETQIDLSAAHIKLTIELLDIQDKIAAQPAHWLIRNTLRYKAMQLAAAFVDPTFQSDDTPVHVRNGKVMSEERECINGIVAPF